MKIKYSQNNPPDNVDRQICRVPFELHNLASVGYLTKPVSEDQSLFQGLGNEREDIPRGEPGVEHGPRLLPFFTLEVEQITSAAKRLEVYSALRPLPWQADVLDALSHHIGIVNCYHWIADWPHVHLMGAVLASLPS